MSSLAITIIRASPRTAPLRRAMLKPIIPPAPTSRSLTSQASLRNKQPNKPSSSPGNNAPGDPEIPKFSLDGLGLSKNMKAFVMTIICIFGTIETWFWCKAIWRWWKGDEATTPESN